MEWNEIKDITSLDAIMLSAKRPTLFFKHSNSCDISLMAKLRLESEDSLTENLDAYLIDVIDSKAVSNYLADKFHVRHESPQIILTYKDECLLDSSHFDINPKEIIEETIRVLQVL